MKSDRKRLKAEKADLVNQMQQLYATLESREEQLRDFIRNYEQHRKVRAFIRLFPSDFGAFLKFFLSRDAVSPAINQPISPRCVVRWNSVFENDQCLCARRVRMR